MALKNPTLQKIVDDLKAKLPAGEKQEFFERIMVGGLKIMFGKEGVIENRISQSSDPVTGIGQGVVDLLGLLFEKSRRTMPWDVGTIAGYALVAEVLDYAEEKQIIGKVDTAVIEQAMSVFQETLLEKMGVTEEKLGQMMSDPRVQEKLKQQAPAQQEAEPEGMIGGAA